MSEENNAVPQLTPAQVQGLAQMRGIMEGQRIVRLEPRVYSVGDGAVCFEPAIQVESGDRLQMSVDDNGQRQWQFIPAPPPADAVALARQLYEMLLNVAPDDEVIVEMAQAIRASHLVSAYDLLQRLNPENYTCAQCEEIEPRPRIFIETRSAVAVDSDEVRHTHAAWCAGCGGEPAFVPPGQQGALESG